MAFSTFSNHLVEVTPRGTPGLVFYDPAGTDGFGMYTPTGTGGDRGAPQTELPDEQTDAANYISNHYPLSNEALTIDKSLHKSMCVMVLADNGREREAEQTYTLFSLSRINRLLREGFKGGKLLVFDELYRILNKYPQACPELIEIQKATQNGEFFKTKGQFSSSSSSSSGDGSVSTEEVLVYGSQYRQMDMDKKTGEYKMSTGFLQSNVAAVVQKKIERLLADWLNKYLSQEDLFFIETNPKTYNAAPTLPMVLRDSENLCRFDVRPGVVDSDTGLVVNKAGTTDPNYGAKDDSLKYENNMQIEFEKTNSGKSASGYVDSDTLRDRLSKIKHDKSNNPVRNDKLQEIQKILMQSQNASHQTKKVKGTSFSSGGTSKDQAPLTNWNSALAVAAASRSQLGSAIEEMKEYFRNCFSKPPSSLLGGDNANLVPLLTKGGVLQYFRFLGVIDTLMDDSKGLHQYGQPYASSQIAKIHLSREYEAVYGIWGNYIPKNSKLYLVIMRNRASEKVPIGYRARDTKLSNSETQAISDWWSTYSGESKNVNASLGSLGLRMDSSNSNDVNLDCASLKRDTYGFSQTSGWCGWEDFGEFEVVPMTWGRQPPNLKDLTYIDIFGKEARGEPILVGKAKYEYIKDNYPWNSLNVAIGRPSVEGYYPTDEEAKEASGALPKINVILHS